MRIVVRGTARESDLCSHVDLTVNFEQGLRSGHVFQVGVDEGGAQVAATEAWDRVYWKWNGKFRIDPAAAESLARQ